MARRIWEVERDRFGITFSGPLEVGECIEVVPATWDGLMTIIDMYYPANVFNGESGDPGAKLIAAIREVRCLGDEDGT